MKQEKYPMETAEERAESYKKVLRVTYKSMYWIAIFLLLPTMGTYIIEWQIVKYARDIGIVIITITCWRINKKMKKKEKEEAN